MTKLNHQIRVIPLGGASELGKNMYCVEIDQKIFILDAGLMYPEMEMLGIDVVIPDTTFLLENKNRVAAIFLTHGHEDHIGALPYVLNEIKVPVYGSKLTLELAKANIKAINKDIKTDFHEVTSKSEIRYGDLSFTFFNTNHSIPGSLGICINTKDGAIVYTGDFKFDQSAHGFYQAEIGKMAAIGEKGVLCLISESNGAEKPGFTPSEANVVTNMSECFYQAKGRIFVACFASNISGLQHIFDAAKQNDKKVAILGKSIETVYHVALNLGFLQVDKDAIIPIKEVNRLPKDKVIVLTTGDQGEPFHVLQKMAKQQHNQINVEKEDTVVLAAPPVYGGELLLAKTMDALARLGAEVLVGRDKIYVSGHGSQEELKMMINLMKPKYLIPVHGEYKMMLAHAKLANSLGIDVSRIALPDNGEVIEIKETEIVKTGKVTAGNVLIDGIGVGDVGNIVLRDRKALSQDGILIVSLTINKREKKIVSGPQIISKGFVYMKGSEEIIEQSKNLVVEAIHHNMNNVTFEWAATKQEIRDQLSAFLYEKTKRRPLIMSIIMEARV